MTNEKTTDSAASALSAGLEALAFLYTEVDRYFGGSTFGPKWPKFLDEAMNKAERVLDEASNVAIEGPEQAQLANGPARMEG